MSSDAVPTPAELEATATGMCYQDCVFKMFRTDEFKPWTLVHGRPTRSIEPFCQYGHAWLESPDGGTAYDVSAEIFMPLGWYYHFGKINPEHCYRYSWERAKVFMLELSHYGPWEGVDAPANRGRFYRALAGEEGDYGTV